MEAAFAASESFFAPDIEAFLNGWNWKETANALMNEAKSYRDKDLEMLGYYYIRAGELYSQSLSVDIYVFNIETTDYSIPPPDESGGWWAITVDFHNRRNYRIDCKAETLKAHREIKALIHSILGIDIGEAI
jgi:hypothetical protein